MWQRPTSGSRFCCRAVVGKELQRDEGSPQGLVFATQYPLGHYDGHKVGSATWWRLSSGCLFLPPSTHQDTIGPLQVLVFATQYPPGHYDGVDVGTATWRICTVCFKPLLHYFLPPCACADVLRCIPDAVKGFPESVCGASLWWDSQAGVGDYSAPAMRHSSLLRQAPGSSDVRSAGRITLGWGGDARGTCQIQSLHLHPCFCLKIVLTVMWPGRFLTAHCDWSVPSGNVEEVFLRRWHRAIPTVTPKARWRSWLKTVPSVTCMVSWRGWHKTVSNVTCRVSWRRQPKTIPSVTPKARWSRQHKTVTRVTARVRWGRWCKTMPHVTGVLCSNRIQKGHVKWRAGLVPFVCLCL